MTDLIKLGRMFLSSGILILAAMSNLFLNTLKRQPNCPCGEGWRVENGIIIANLLILVSIANLIISLNKIIYKIPLIGTAYMGLYGLFIFMLLYILSSISHELDDGKCKECKIENVNMLYTYFKDINYKSCLYATFIIIIATFI